MIFKKENDIGEDCKIGNGDCRVLGIPVGFIRRNGLNFEGESAVVECQCLSHTCSVYFKKPMFGLNI